MITFEQVTDYICTFDPDFRHSIVPALDAEIDELESLRNAPLPAIYRDFLETMGRSMGWINVRDIDFGIDTVLDVYRASPWLQTTDLVRIGTDRRDPSFHPYLRPSAFSDTVEVLAIRECDADSFPQTAYNGGRFQIAGSLPEMVCLPAFEMYEIYGPGRRPAKLQATEWRPEAVNEAATILTDAGFQPLFWSSPESRGFKRDDAAVQISQWRGFPLLAAVRADDPDQQAKIAQALSVRLA